MKTLMTNENLTSNERNARIAISTLAVVAAMESSLVGTPAFAVINILAIVLATTAIIGWDPLKALLRFASQSLVTPKVALPDQRV